MYSLCGTQFAISRFFLLYSRISVAHTTFDWFYIFVYSHLEFFFFFWCRQLSGFSVNISDEISLCHLSCVRQTAREYMYDTAMEPFSTDRNSNFILSCACRAELSMAFTSIIIRLIRFTYFYYPFGIECRRNWILFWLAAFAFDELGVLQCISVESSGWDSN